MQHTFNMKNLFHAVAIRDFDVDNDGLLNASEMKKMLDTYGLRHLGAEQFQELPEATRTTITDLALASILDYNVKMQQERRQSIEQGMNIANS